MPAFPTTKLTGGKFIAFIVGNVLTYILADLKAEKFKLGNKPE
jgi:hypothetical protein